MHESHYGRLTESATLWFAERSVRDLDPRSAIPDVEGYYL